MLFALGFDLCPARFLGGGNLGAGGRTHLPLPFRHGSRRVAEEGGQLLFKSGNLVFDGGRAFKLGRSEG